LRVLPGELARIDAWVKAQPKPRPSRPEAIRRLAELGLGSVEGPKPLSKKSASKASALAAEQIDRLQRDKPVTDDERARRKGRLLKGPSEFREIRDDLPKKKR
jgi:hypothetical protein